MHDELLERRLRAALADEVRGLTFTITAAELERRAALRGRSAGNRRLTLLLAAAVALGVLGAGGLLSGALLNPRPGPSAPAAAVESDEPSEPAPPPTFRPSGPGALPSLDELMATGSGQVLFAQAHDRIETRTDLLQEPGGALSGVTSPMLFAPGDYDMTIVCSGGSTLQYGLGSSSPYGTIRCDGTVTEGRVGFDGLAHLVLSYREPTSWRVVVRGTPVAVPLPSADPILPAAEPGFEELLRFDDQTTTTSDGWRDTGLRLTEVTAVPGRANYHAQLWCPPDGSVRLIFGDRIANGPELTAETETVVRCDGLVMNLDLRIVEPNGSRVFIAAAPGSRWSLVVTSAQPPVSLARPSSGWQVAMGYGPEYAFDEHGVSLSGAGVEGGGPLRVTLDCVSGTPIEVAVALDSSSSEPPERFTADCTNGRSVSTRTYADADANVQAWYTAPVGSWSALTLLVPAPSPTGP